MRKKKITEEKEFEKELEKVQFDESEIESCCRVIGA